MVHLLFFHYCISGKPHVNNGVDSYADIALPLYVKLNRFYLTDGPTFRRLRLASLDLNIIASSSAQLTVTSGQFPQRL